MYEYEVTNRIDGREDIIFGYSAKDAMERRGYNPKEWEVWCATYID